MTYSIQDEKGERFGLKQALSGWLAGNPPTIGDRAAQVVQGMTARKSPVKLYFDAETGLLVRLVRYTDSPVGRNPTRSITPTIATSQESRCPFT